MTPNRRLLVLAVATALAFSDVAPASAQGVASAESAALVTGRVTEAARGVALNGAIVTLDGQRVVTERNGEFRLANVAPGRYTLRVDYVGYEARELPVEVGADGSVRVEVVLDSTADTTLAVVEVRATRDAQALALNQQRSSTNAINVVSADLLGRFPDANVAESTQRIPGVSVQRDQGEGRYVNVRGAPLNFTNVSVDGVQLAAPNPSERAVELDTIPSSVIAALEVTKALTPDMDADAIAGQINIVTQSALDRDGMILRGSLGLGEFQLGSGDNQRATASIGNRFGPGRNFGLLVAASASKAGRFTDNVETEWFRDGATGQILPEVTEIKDYEGERTRRGVTARFDARLDDDNLVYFIASGSKFRDKEYRNTFTIEYERFTPDSTGTSGEAGRATFDKEIRERIQEQSINTFNLGGEHWVGDWRLDWQGSYSLGELELPARQQLIYRSTLRPRMRYDFSNPDFPRFTILNSDGTVRQEGINLPESLYAFRRYNQRYEKAEEEELGLRLDATRPQSFIGESGDIAFGLRLRQKDKESNDDRSRNAAGPAPAYADTLCPRVSNNFGRFEFGRVFCNNVFTRFVPQLDNASLRPLVEASIVSDYEAYEDISAAYFRIDARWDRLSMIAGARYEHTDVEGRAAEFRSDSGTATPVASSRTYGEFLPSLHFRYEFDEDTILRWSYSTALSRPNFNQFVPRLVISENARSASAGNPDIRATTSQNLDLSIEHYIRPLGLVSAGLFYKRLDNPIFVVNSDVVGGPFDGLNLSQPANGDGGSLSGIELAWQQTFDGLPAPWDGLGVYANYTYVNSDADLPLGLGSSNLPGTSKHNANFAVFYEKHGLNLRLAYNYRSEYLDSVDIEDSELDVYWDERAILDFTASYQLGERWQVFAEVNNVNDTVQRRYQGGPNRVLELEQFGRFWMLGASFEY